MSHRYHQNEHSDLLSRIPVPRNKTFEPDEALEKAMHLFWRKGYYDTSIEDLVQHVGVSRYGLYSVFGSKHRLFLAALDRYCETVLTRLFAPIEAPGASLAAIQRYFETAIASFKTPQGQLGCLMCNTATELAPHDPQAADRVRATLQRASNAFRQALENAQRQGEIASSINVEAQADYFTGIVQGLCVYARSRASPETIERFIHIALSTLE